MLLFYVIILLWHKFDRHCHYEVDSQYEITPVAAPRIVPLRTYSNVAMKAGVTP